MLLYDDYVKITDIFKEIEEVKITLQKQTKSLRLKVRTYSSDIEVNADLYEQAKRDIEKYSETRRQDIIIHCINLINTNNCREYKPRCEELLYRGVLCEECLHRYLYRNKKEICSSCTELVNMFYEMEREKQYCSICTMKIIIQIHQNLCYYIENTIKVDKKFVSLIVSILQYKLKDVEFDEFIKIIQEKREKHEV